MTMNGITHRRGFLGGLAASAVSLGLPWDRLRADTRTVSSQSNQDTWLAALTGKHRCLFDFPQNAEGLPLLHMYNYINTYQSAYGAKTGEVNAVGTFYFIGPTSSIPLAFNDAMWAKYKFGEFLKLTDPTTKAPSVRNMFNAPQPGDPVLFGGAMVAASIPNLQKMGSTFLLCNNALMFLIGELAKKGMGTAADIDKDLRANVLPGVVTVPAMVVAIEKAQTAGIAYNKQ